MRWESCTPLHRAAYWGHLECVKLLLQAGASTDHKSSWIQGSDMMVTFRHGQLLESLGTPFSRGVYPEAHYEDLVQLIESYMPPDDILLNRAIELHVSKLKHHIEN